MPPKKIVPTEGSPHPARYHTALLRVMAPMLHGKVLDPFAGTGRCFLMEQLNRSIKMFAIELEPEWAIHHPRTRIGNALDLPWPNNYFDCSATSPCYGNRMADCHVQSSRDRSTRGRNTYTHKIGRKLHPDNAGQMQWGEKYREFHRRAWAEMTRATKSVFVLNVKDHIRGGDRMPVTDWHISTLEDLGWVVSQHVLVDCPGNRMGANGSVRIPYESVVRMTRNVTIPTDGRFAHPWGGMIS